MSIAFRCWGHRYEYDLVFASTELPAREGMPTAVGIKRTAYRGTEGGVMCAWVVEVGG